MVSDKIFPFQLGVVTKLEKIDLCGCQRLSDASLTNLCVNNPGLTYLNLTWCLSITDLGITEGICALPNGLNLLGLFGNTTITQVSLDALASHSGHVASLETLDLNGCNAIPSENREETHLQGLFPNCKEFVYHS